MARHQLADGAPRAKVDRGWHPPYSSLASPLESKYHLQNHPTASPTLVGMLTGICCPHGVSLRQVHGSMGTCFYVFMSFMHSSCCVSLYATNLGGAQISLSTVKSTSEHENAPLLYALLRCQQNYLYELYNTYCTRSPWWHCPWRITLRIICRPRFQV